MIRGESLTNPPLILLHGGPGFPETHFFRHFNAPLEKAFTVVYWEQRGSGKSFDSKISRSSMTVERFIADLDELVEAVCKRGGFEMHGVQDTAPQQLVVKDTDARPFRTARTNTASSRKRAGSGGHGRGRSTEGVDTARSF